MILEIQGFEFLVDSAFALDLIVALGDYHGRLGDRIHTTTDMQAGTKFAKTMIAVQASHDEIERRYTCKTRNDAGKDIQP